MATTVSERTANDVTTGDQCVTLRGIGWKGFLTVLRLRGDCPVPRMIYLDGDLLLVSPSGAHELLKKRLGSFVHEIVVGLEIHHVPTASTTFRRRAKQAGVEGDETYYLANADRVQGKTEFNLRTDPPPDLAIEAVHTHDAKRALEVYRRLRVPEVWICDQEKLRILERQANGRYRETDSSKAFPFLNADEIFAWVTRPEPTSETFWVKDLRTWVRDVLIPRRAGIPT